jgi:hypothetical protein
MNGTTSPLQGKPAESSLMVTIYLLMGVIIVAQLTWLSLKAFILFGFSPDFAWLLQTGNYLLEHGELPSHDLFSWTAPQRPLMSYQWLFEALLAVQHRLLGIDRLIQFYAVICLAMYVVGPWLLNTRYRINVLAALYLGAASALMSSYNLQVRPMLATCAFLLIQFGLVERYRLGRIRLAVLLPITGFYYMVWGNMHVFVLVGLASLVLFAIADLMQQARLAQFNPPEPSIEGRPIGLKDYAWLLTASFSGSLINPYGYKIYSHILNFLAVAGESVKFDELGSPDFQTLQMQIFAGLLLLFILLMTKVRRVFSPHETLHLLAFSFASLYSTRFVVWAALFFAIILPRALWRLSDSMDLGRYQAIQTALLVMDRHRLTIVSAYLCLSVVAALIVPRFMTTRITESCAKYEPAITAYGSLKKDSDRLLNDDVMGSCLIMYPSAPKVFIDTRFDFYASEHTAKLAKALFLKKNWKDIITDWKIDTFILRADLPLTELLSNLPDYDVLYGDEAVKIIRLKQTGGSGG